MFIDNFPLQSGGGTVTVTESTTDSTSYELDSFAVDTNHSCHWIYQIQFGQAFRTGRIQACWNDGTDMTYDDFSTTDDQVGDSSDLVFSVVKDESDIRLMTASVDMWTIRYIRQQLL